jgi:glycosyltransferase involved in cell wall biosynthesis
MPMSRPAERSTPLHIGIIGPSRFPVAEPFAGGLESHVWTLAGALRERGHRVSLFAAPGSDRRIAHRYRPLELVAGPAEGRRDLSVDPRLEADESAAYLSLMNHLADGGSRQLDIIHNHSLHELPLALAHRMSCPMVSTLHTPPIAAVRGAMRLQAHNRPFFVAVSSHAADSWADASLPVGVVHNGVDTDLWRFGDGGARLIWFGRIVPEKGVELAIAAARRLGRPIDIAGPIVDPHYFASAVGSQLGPDVGYLGHLGQPELAAAVGAAGAALVTPRWDEPFGLVVAEALSCGTPVAAFRRGGIPEILTPAAGRLATPDDVASLSGATSQALLLPRDAVRRHALAEHSLTSMLGKYEAVYRHVISRHHRATRRRAPHLPMVTTPHGPRSASAGERALTT